MLRIVAGLILPTAGTASIGGVPISEPRSETGIVFQAPTLLPWASVMDNVLFPLRMMHRMDSGSADKAAALIKLVGLVGFEGKVAAGALGRHAAARGDLPGAGP